MKTIFLLIFLILVTACQTTTTSFDADYRTGYGGVTATIQDLPRTALSKNMPFNAHILLKNLGAYNIEPNSIDLKLAYSSAYLNLENTEPLKPFRWLIDEELEGRNIQNPLGGEVISEILNFKTTDVEKETTAEFTIELCYPYRTNATTTACIGRIKAPGNCPEGEFNLDIGTGQGAPLAVENIKQELIKYDIDKVTPRFTFDIINSRKGFPFKLDQENPLKLCTEVPKIEEIQNVLENFYFTLKLGPDLEYDSKNPESGDFACTRTTRLQDNKATISCTLKEGLKEEFAYQLDLNIDLEYGYKEKMPPVQVSLTNR